MSESIFAIRSYSVTGLSVTTAIAAALTLAVGLFLLRRRGWTRSTSLFVLVNAIAAAWLVGFALTYSATTEAVALFWARAAQLPLALLSAAALHLAVAHASSLRSRALPVAGWVLSAGVGLLGSASSVIIAGVARRPWGFHPVAGEGFLLTVVVSAILYTAAIVVLWIAFRRSEGAARDHTGVLLIAFVLGTPGFLDVLPALGIEVYPVGYISALIFALLGAAAIGQYRLIDLTPQFAASQILETMKSAVILVDMHGTIRVVNRAATHLLGYSESALVGQPMRTIFDPDENTSTRRILNSTGILEQQMGWQHANGSRVDVLTSSSFVRGGDGAPVGVVYVASDYTERKRAEQALRDSEHRYRKLFDVNPLPMWVYDFQSLRFIAVNDVAVRHYGYSREEFLQMTITDIRPADDVPQVLALLPLLSESGGPSTFRHMKKDGTVIDVEISSFEFSLDQRTMRLVIAHDVTERRRAEQRLRESEARYRLLFERNLAGVYRTSVDGRVLDCNESFARIFGYDTPEEMLQSSARSLYFEESDRQRILVLLRERGALTNHEARMRRRDGSAVWVLENMTLLEGESGESAVVEGTVVDITGRKYAQEQVEYQAYHDVLTGLPNRLLFRDRLRLALAHARRNSRVLAVMYLDLDEFKSVNDTLGHTVGDGLLQEIATRLRGSVRAEDTVARMGGDEFTILLPDVGDGRGASTVARKVLDSVAASVVVEQHELHVTPSIGIALFPGDGFDAESLLKNADRAMYRAKQLGRNNYQYATPPPFDDRFSLQRRLTEALEKEEFLLHYQPVVDIESGRITSVEALLRWSPPGEPLRHPDAFMVAAEEADVMLRLGEWILRTACREVRSWRESGLESIRVAVNLSARQFEQPGLVDDVARVLRETGVDGGALELEISESAVMANAEHSFRTMTALRNLGVRLAIDDFGTGYSSFRYLRRLPIDVVKVDREFVRDIVADSADRATLSAVISMARALGLTVVAEGVETGEQLDFLRAERCAAMQGFLYSRPVDAAGIAGVLKGGAEETLLARAPEIDA